jgi:DNA-binding NtrC family response regulator
VVRPLRLRVLRPNQTLAETVYEGDDLPDMIRFGESHRGSLIIDSPTLTLEELEKEYILKVLNHTRWQKKRASEVLGINASTLYRKLIAYGVERPGSESEDGPIEDRGEGEAHAA